MFEIKKWVGLALALALLAATPLPADAAVMGGMVSMSGGGGSTYQLETDLELSDEQKQALEKIYEIIPELRTLTEISVSKDETADTWHVWLHEAQDAEEAVLFAAESNLIFAAGTGELLVFDLRNPAWASKEEPSRELARRQADVFIRQLLGDQADQFQIGDFGGSGYNFNDGEGNEISWQTLSVNYHPLVNGLPFLSRATRVDVDAAGHITGWYDYRYDPSNQVLDFSLFPPAQVAVSLAEAEKILTEKTTMQLTYLLGYPYVKQDSPLLAYMPAGFPGYIDALTGEPVEMYTVWQPQQEQVRLDGQGEKLTARSQAEAEALLSRQFGVDMGQMDFHPSENAGWYPENEKVVCYSWYMTDEGEQPGNWLMMRSVDLRTLADSGEVVGFYLRDYPVQDKQVALSQEDALAVALRFMEKVLPEGETEMQLSISPTSLERIPEWVDQSLLEQEYLLEPQEVGFNFGRLHQGIPVSGAGYYITVSLVTGEVTNYSKYDPVMPAALPDGSQVVPAEQAKAEYLKNTPLQLVYIWPERIGQRAPAPLLVYATRTTMDWYFIDALTGKAVLFDPTAN